MLFLSCKIYSVESSYRINSLFLFLCIIYLSAIIVDNEAHIF